MKASLRCRTPSARNNACVIQRKDYGDLKR